jgi:hypothetical protein
MGLVVDTPYGYGVVVGYDYHKQGLVVEAKDEGGEVVLCKWWSDPCIRHVKNASRRISEDDREEAIWDEISSEMETEEARLGYEREMADLLRNY